MALKQTNVNFAQGLTNDDGTPNQFLADISIKEDSTSSTPSTPWFVVAQLSSRGFADPATAKAALAQQLRDWATALDAPSQS